MFGKVWVISIYSLKITTGLLDAKNIYGNLTKDFRVLFLMKAERMLSQDSLGDSLSIAAVWCNAMVEEWNYVETISFQIIYYKISIDETESQEMSFNYFRGSFFNGPAVFLVFGAQLQSLWQIYTECNAMQPFSIFRCAVYTNTKTKRYASERNKTFLLRFALHSV